ncbi:Glycosyltransferase [Quillaja saponaria]|uniref:Glycosyltransferase n=1 Tax=Quillaja saponaria TaxID=32244 RepID=A0AAD7PUA8_QUISA|nr:Glycosyltransferase [Quillaja saponaria]
MLSVCLENAELPDTDMSAAPFTDTSILQEPLKQLLIQHPPDCIIIDAFHRWAADTIDELQITRIIFNGNGCFPRCVQENIKRYGPHEKAGSDWEPFVVPGLPDRIELKRSQLAGFFRHPSGFPDRMKKSEEKSFGTVINSFYDLEPAYADNIQIEMGKKAWLIGPVSLCNRNTTDKAERGKLSTIDEQSCLNWLNCKEPNSVLYISFGSLARLVLEQLWEIAYGLEATGISAGVPMITWPLSAEQFYNEKLITDVLRIGVQVGSEEWKSWNERQALVGREKIEVAVKMVIGNSEEMVEMRMRAKDIAGKARRAVEVGGTSYNDADTLIEDLKALRQRQKC